VLGEIKHVLRDFDVLDLVEILTLASNFVGIAQQRADQRNKFPGSNRIFSLGLFRIVPKIDEQPKG
jgi:hypothetical protein